ncbi:MAG TPA: lipocalin family protein [Candidatus Hydrogenedentes bacterium]|nr:lipocalin family protein [Candidatus Hydrogenedentota bacterium]HQM51460.1 lipocalin family protein [Candidatus Hydrogenedentota bacterium]
MNRTAVVSLIAAVVVCVVAALVWWPRSEETPALLPAQPDPPRVEKPQTPLPAPPVVEAPAPAPSEPQPPEEPPAAVPEEVTQAVPEQAPATDDPFGGKPITVETLTGCKEVQQIGNGQLVIEYGANGEWKMNGNVRAKWTIEGDKVKIYKDGTDEVHYIEIINNKLVYNGKVLKMTR